MLRFLFSFSGEVDRRQYLPAALPAFLVQTVYVLAVLVSLQRTEEAFKPGFIFNPVRSLIGIASNEVTLGGLALLILSTWIILALTLKRLRHAGAPLSLAALAIMPMLQLPVILVLAARGRLGGQAGARPHVDDPDRGEDDVKLRAMLVGAIAGVTFCVGASVLATLAFRTYGWGVFVVTPVLTGIISGYIARRRTDFSAMDTAGIAVSSVFLSGLALLGLAIEGIICLAMSVPLMMALAAIGGWIGHAAAVTMGGPRATLSAMAMLPIVMLVEVVLPPESRFVSSESIEVAASADDVWRAITNMGVIDDPPAAPFGWGLAYPIAGEIDGEGVGAIRRGVFSTGAAFEQVTVWDPGRELTFDVLSNPPALKELSPYEHVHAPHLAEYFTTAYAKFTITPMAEGRVRLTLETAHELNLEPAVYWAPIAQWAIQANKTRVLEHFARLAETGAGN